MWNVKVTGTTVKKLVTLLVARGTIGSASAELVVINKKMSAAQIEAAAMLKTTIRKNLFMTS